MRRRGKIKFIFVVFGTIVVIIVSMLVILLSSCDSNNENGDFSNITHGISPTPTNENGNDNDGDDNGSDKTHESTSRIDVLAVDVEFLSTVVKERLMERNFLYLESDDLDKALEPTKAFEIRRFDNYIQIRVRLSIDSEELRNLRENFENLVYDHGARDLDDKLDLAPLPTTNVSEDYNYLVITIYEDNI